LVGTGAEVFQQCFEVLVAIIVFIDLRVFLSRVHPLLGHMQRMFDKSYPDIQAKCQTAERRIVIYMSGFGKSINLIDEVNLYCRNSVRFQSMAWALTM
jgi:hypothetical protein